MYSEEYISKGREETSSKISQEEEKMKRKRFTALKVTLTAMMLTAALTFGAGSAYAADLSQEGGSEPTVTITPSPPRAFRPRTGKVTTSRGFPS